MSTYIKARHLFGAALTGPPGAVTPLSAGLPDAAFPGAVASDANLAVAVDRLQTKLSSAMGAADATMTVASAAGIAANVLLSIGDEIVRTTGAPSGNLVPVARGFDGTTPAAHPVNAPVSGFIDAYHHNTLASEIQAIEQALGPNLVNVPGVAPFVVASGYDFMPVTVGGSIGAGLQTITIAPVPRGVNGGNIGQMLWIAGGTGAPEAVPIVGGSAVAGAASGTLFIQCANAHSGSWTVESASDGIQEAIVDAGPGKLIFVPAGTYTIRGKIVTPHDNQRIVGAGRSESLLTVPNAANLSQVFQVSGRKELSIEALGFEGNVVNQTAGICFAIDVDGAPRMVIRGCKFAHFGSFGPPAVQGSGGGIKARNSPALVIADNLFAGNTGFDINFGSSRGMWVTGNQFGVATLEQSRTNVSWWDTQAAGIVGSVYGDGSPDMLVSNNQIYGSSRTPSDFQGGAAIRLAGGCPGSVVVCNSIDGLSTYYGTVAVTQGSAVVNVSGVSSAFRATTPVGGGDVNRFIQIEGEAALHRIKTIDSPTQASLYQAVARTSAAGLRYRMPIGGDAVGVVSCSNSTITGNSVRYGGDMGFSLGDQALGVAMDYVTVTGNSATHTRNSGLTVYGRARFWDITGNSFCNNGQTHWVSMPPFFCSGISMDPLTEVIQGIVVSGNVLSGDELQPDFPVVYASVSPTNPATFNCSFAHLLVTGDSVIIEGGTGSWAALNGTRTVTVVDAGTFTVAVAAAGFTGSFGGTVTATQVSWQRCGLGLHPESPAKFSLLLYGPNVAFQIISNVPLTGSVYGFTSVGLT